MSCGGREAAKAASSDPVKVADRISDRIWTRVAELHRSPGRLLLTPDGALSRGLVIGVAVLFTLPTANYFWKYEGGAPHWFFVSSVTLTLAACAVLMFGRILVAAVLVNALVGIVATVAWAKHQAMDMVLHAYDLVFYLSSWSTIGFIMPRPS